MDRLRLLARPEHQRAERGEQTFLVEHALDHRQHVLVQRHFPEDAVVGEEIVDAQRLEALERGPGGTETVLALDTLHRLLQTRDEIGGGRALDDGIAVVPNPLDMRLNGTFRQHRGLPVGAVVGFGKTLAGPRRFWEGPAVRPTGAFSRSRPRARRSRASAWRNSPAH